MRRNEIDQKIANRESWFRIILISIFSALIAYKVIVTPYNFSNFNFMDLLNLILALFAIGMSVAFYFKANDTSNQFYDNTYKFTQDMSEILGRIESGFGERLRHLDEGFQRFQSGPVDTANMEKEIEHEEKKLEKTEQEKETLINDLLNKANLIEEEKENVLINLKQKDRELEEAKRELESLRETLRNATNDVPFWRQPGLRSIMRSVINKHIEKYGLSEAKRLFFNPNNDKAQYAFKIVLNENLFMSEMLLKHQIINLDGNFTESGFALASDIFKREIIDKEENLFN